MSPQAIVERPRPTSLSKDSIITSQGKPRLQGLERKCNKNPRFSTLANRSEVRRVVGTTHATEANPEALTLNRHRMLLLAPGNQFAIDEAKIKKLAGVTRLGRSIQDRRGDVVGIGPAGIAPDLGVLVLIGDDVGLAPILAHLGHG